jgi:hypothetical protein
MNKDLDERLLAPGEYRDAKNIRVGRSSSDSIGGVEAIRGSTSLSAGVFANLHCIGEVADEVNDKWYVFVTDSSETHGIYEVDNSPSTTVVTALVTGTFLNFSTTNLITGVNVLEGYLYWTDDLNQPRKINIAKAKAPGSYYSTEDNISVAKYNPYKAISLLDDDLGAGSEVSGMTNDITSAVQDPTFLEDKFVRFSYRYKFEDGTYSLMAPFSQICFIPDIDKNFTSGLEEDSNLTDERLIDAYESTIIKFFENDVTSIRLDIPLPGIELYITHVEVLYKESDALSVKAVKSLAVSSSTATNIIFI